MGVKGACPLGLLPPLGERGGHARNIHDGSKKNAGGFLKSFFFVFFTLPGTAREIRTLS
jgi:hypothetical protein